MRISDRHVRLDDNSQKNCIWGLSVQDLEFRVQGTSWHVSREESTLDMLVAEDLQVEKSP